ncbi:MAG: aldo/keto reductase [Micrococcales bacterium]|nr:aldo/keto reductase [Micrococcales bacterium]
MKTIAMPGSFLEAPAVISGMMRISDMPDPQIRAMTDAALEAGINFFDHADVYGPTPHHNERRWAKAINLSEKTRQDMIIQTKAGIVNEDGPYFDFSASHIIESVNGSLAALGTDYIDILLLHRPDALMEPYEVAQAFDQLWHQGKVHHFGVSNFNPAQIELLTTALRQPIIANQVQLSIAHCPIIAASLAPNMGELDQSIERGAGLVEYCHRQQITLQAWSPFQAGFFGGSFIGDRERFGPLNLVLDRLAAEYQVDPIAIASAWLLRHPAGIQVVLGTTRPERIKAAAAGCQVHLTRPQWYELFRAAGFTVP